MKKFLRIFITVSVITLFCLIHILHAGNPLVSSSGTVLTVTIASTSTSPTTPPVTPPGGGGGGGGGNRNNNPTSQVTFQGIAYPGSQVTLMRDGQTIARIPAGPDAIFNISVSDLSGGTYTFGVYAEDSRGVRSVTHTFSETITTGVSTIISGIFLPPTISVDKSEVRYGDPITILGQSAPETTITVKINSTNELTKTATTDSHGIWKYVLDSLELEKGTHSTMARAATLTSISIFSGRVGFVVGDQNVINEQTKCRIADLNCDGHVNIVDFSILAYWYRRALSADAAKTVDLNHDGKVDLIDFSIMAYYWTG
jgi:hypothetical protein